jgi:hypothetical protein
MKTTSCKTAFRSDSHRRAYGRGPNSRTCCLAVAVTATVCSLAAGADLSGYRRSDGINSVVYRDPSNQIYELYLDTSGWHSANLSWLAGAPSAAGAPFGFVRSDGVNAVVYRGVDSHIYELHLSTAWTVVDLSARTGAPPAAFDPVGYVRSDGLPQ